MENKELQVENGNYTRIVNKVIDELVKSPLLGAELQVCLFVIRKTYGFNKLEDEISITQFEQGVCKSRPTIVKALKNLQLVNILKLVKKGDSRKSSNLWAFNKYYETWKLDKAPKLVKGKDTTSKVNGKKLVKTPKHTKDNYKTQVTKDREVAIATVTPRQEALEFFSNTEKQKEMFEVLKAKGVPEDIARKELWAFINHWAELDKSGKKQRWELQKTFELNRRIATWFSRSRTFNNFNVAEKKGIRL